MPLRLKSLELHGYKTFAARTVFEFSEGITAIVGPNGSGKSNIADALRWVLGEQSYLLLRGKKTEDMIFHGSESRPRSGMGSATIVFDNSDGWLPLEFTEVAVARRAYRDGRNEYLLNNQHLRLRDLNDLLAQSGLSERTYTILGQGMVDASLALKSEDRRRLFEEAAGIGLFRSRREESLRRLDSTQRNLERVLDILSELEPRLRSLERQARRAQEYRQVQADLRLMLLDWYGFHWHGAQRELAQVRAAAQEQETRSQGARLKFQESLQEVQASRQQILQLRATLSEWSQGLALLVDQRENGSRELVVAGERLRALTESRQQALQEKDRLNDDVMSLEESLAEASADAERRGAEMAEAVALEQDSRRLLSDRQSERAQVEAQLLGERETLSAMTAERTRKQAHLDELRRRFEALRPSLENVETDVAQAGANLQRAVAEHVVSRAALERAEVEVTAANNQLVTARMRLDELEADRRARLDERAKAAAEHARQAAQLEVLEQAEKSLAGLADGTRALLEAAREGRLAGSRGTISAVLDVPAELEVAIAAALGDRMESILLSGGETLEHALELLEKDSSGRAALLPLEQLAAQSSPRATNDNACLGVASSLVNAPDFAGPAIALLLGQTLIVRDRSSARRLLRETGAQRAVTLRGEVFWADGLVIAGRETRASALGRPRQKREMQASLAAMASNLEGLDQALQVLAAELEQAREGLTAAEVVSTDKRRRLESSRTEEQQAGLAAESARRQAEWQASRKADLRREMSEAQDQGRLLAREIEQADAELARIHDSVRLINMQLAELDLQEFIDQVTVWNTRAQVAEGALGEARRRLAERQEALSRLTAQVDALDSRLAGLDQTQSELEVQQAALSSQETELNTRIAELRSKIEPAQVELQAAERAEGTQQVQESAAQRALQAVERESAQAQILLARKQEAVENLRRRIVDDFGLVELDYEVPAEVEVPLPLGNLVATLPQVQQLDPELDTQLVQKKAQLRRMGAINPEAQQEYEETLERFNYLSAQIEDLREAEADLRQVIAELDEVTRKEFLRTFDAVAGYFKEIFVRLFGGGSARLLMTDPDNLNETGIDIEARLPGKREQGLALLSGGERSLTAIALVFALLKVAPTPLCVLDEVDAMLDEANVGRFRDLLDELSQDTQFIVITHNRNTVQAADRIYGVTMGRDSASQVISLRLDELTENMLER